jgi:hypothetical protein
MVEGTAMEEGMVMVEGMVMAEVGQAQHSMHFLKTHTQPRHLHACNR